MTPEQDIGFQLYKLEYELGARRYEDLYRATWTNFSYLTVIAGGIFAFGSRYLSEGWTALLAITPLVFWYWAVFMPMNRYGDQVVERLRQLEDILNEIYGDQLRISGDTSDPPIRGLRHYSNFRGAMSTQTFPNWLKVRKVVRDAGYILLICVGIYAAYAFYKDWQKSLEGRTIKIDPYQKILEVKVEGAEGRELRGLPQQVRELQKELHDTKVTMAGLSKSIQELQSELRERR